MREEGKIPGWMPSLFPSVSDCERTGSALPFIPLGRQSPNSWRNLKPVPNPSAHQPKGPLPNPHYNRMSVCAGECVSGKVNVRESRTTPRLPAPRTPATTIRK